MTWRTPVVRLKAVTGSMMGNMQSFQDKPVARRGVAIDLLLSTRYHMKCSVPDCGIFGVFHTCAEDES